MQRLAISTSLVVLLLVALVIGSLAHFEVTGRSGDHAQRLKGDLQTLVSVLAAPASAGDTGAVRHVLAAFAARAGVERVVWTDPRGSQVAVTGAPVSPGAPAWFEALVGGPEYFATQRIVVGSTEHGQAALRLNPTVVVNEAWALVASGTPIVLGGMCALSLALLLVAGHAPLLLKRQISAMNSLRASQSLSRRLAMIVEQSNDAIIARDLNGTILSWNTGAERLYGWTAPEAVGKSARELHLGGFSDADYALMLARMRERGTWAVDGPRVTKAGTTVQVSVTLAPLLDEDGQVVGEVGIGRDVTALTQAQCALVLANERLEARVRERTTELTLNETLLRAVMDAMPGVVVFLDAQQRHQLFNRRLEEWLALDAAAIRGKTLCEVTGEGNLSICLPYLKRAQAGERVRFEWLYRSPEGELRDIDTTLVPVPAVGGKNSGENSVSSGGIASFSMDISDRKRADAKLRDSLARNRVLVTMVEHSTDSIHARDLDGNVTYWNHGAEQVTGFSAAEAMGQPLRSLHLREKSEAELAAILARIRAGCATDFEGQRLSKSGQTIDVAIRTEPLFDEDDRLSGEVCVLRDITETKNDERELRRAKEVAEAANRAKSEFLANMSHEIRTPLNGVLGLTELVLDSELTREQRADLELVQTAGRSLMTILNDILDLSKIEAGQLQIEAFEFAPADSIADTLKLLAPRAHQKGLTLRCDARDTPPRVLGDPGRLRQIVMNLVGNAIKFTARGEVAVTVSTLPDEADATVTLQVSVRDSGIGIAPEQHATIFDAFTQADASTTRRYGGTGLGLSISAKLVRLMGGAIRVDSVPDQGSTFSFTLKCGVPLAAPAPAPALLAGTAGTARALAALEGHSVLVVEDNASYSGALLRMLAGWGMLPAAASDGESALAMLRQASSQGRPYTLLLLDVLLPGMDGYAVARQVKAEPHLAGNVVVLTGAGQRGDGARWLELGAAAYLSKPVQAAELFEALVALISRPAGEAPSSLVTRHSLREARQGASILVAEDNETNQVVARRVLKKLGYRVQMANNGQQALDAIARETFDLVLMDMQMPVMGGLEAAAAIRLGEADGPVRVPIVALTAGAMQADRDSCLAAGMDGFLAKPYTAAEIDAVIKRWLPDGAARVAWAGVDTGAAAFDHGTQQDPPKAEAPSRALDVAVLKGCIGDDDEGVDEFLRSYLDSSAKAAAALHEAHRARRADTVSGISHSLKSTARTVGAIEVGELCAQLEAAGQQGDWPTIDAAMPGFDTLLAAAAADANEWLAAHSP